MAKIAPAMRSEGLRGQLEALRDRLAAEIDSPELDSRSLPALTKELRETIKAIDALPVVGGVSRLQSLVETVN